MESKSSEEPEDLAGTFWQFAREKIGHTSLEPLIGQLGHSSLMPPVVQLADDPQQATQLVNQILAKEKTVITSPAEDYSNTEMPAAGDLMIVCDGDGIPLALTRTQKVEIAETEISETLVRLYPPVLKQLKQEGKE